MNHLLKKCDLIWRFTDFYLVCPNQDGPDYPACEKSCKNRYFLNHGGYRD